MKKKFLIFIRPAVLTLFFFGCMHHPSDQSMRAWDHMMGFGGMFMWLILLIVAGIIVYFVYNRSKGTGNSTDPAAERPVEILKRRYARGEISKEEFERLKKEIES